MGKIPKNGRPCICQKHTLEVSFTLVTLHCDCTPHGHTPTVISSLEQLSVVVWGLFEKELFCISKVMLVLTYQGLIRHFFKFGSFLLSILNEILVGRSTIRESKCLCGNVGIHDCPSVHARFFFEFGKHCASHRQQMHMAHGNVQKPGRF